MWLTCPARSSRRRQQGTMVRLGSCWQTIPGPSAISSCFPPQRPTLEVDCTYLFLFYKTDMKDKAFYVCLLWHGFAIGTFKKTPSENQSTGVRLMSDPSGLECWDQLVSLGPLILLTFRLNVAWLPQPLLSNMYSLSSSHYISEIVKAKGKVALWVLSTWKWLSLCRCCSEWLRAPSENLAISHAQPCGEWQSLTSAAD